MRKRSAAAIIGPGRIAKAPTAVDLLDAEALHHAVLDHLAAAAAALFGRLEDHHRRAVEVARGGQVLGRAHQHGGVPVMAAGVHLARHLGAPGQIGLLLDRQGVHVGTQAHDLAGCVGLALDDGDHAGAPDPGYHLVAAELAQLGGHHLGRAHGVEQQLRVLVKVAAPLGHFGGEGGDLRVNGHLSLTQKRADGPAKPRRHVRESANNSGQSRPRVNAARRACAMSGARFNGPDR
jgi:hypothetical protein